MDTTMIVHRSLNIKNVHKDYSHFHNIKKETLSFGSYFTNIVGITYVKPLSKVYMLQKVFLKIRNFFSTSVFTKDKSS
jgi:hypothetical protein